MTEHVRRGRPTGYTPKMGKVVYRLMSQGLSLTAAAAAMGISRATIHNWMKKYPELLDSVDRGKAARVFKLEIELLASDNAAFINARRFALVNAAPEEWREKQAVDARVLNFSPKR